MHFPDLLWPCLQDPGKALWGGDLQQWPNTRRVLYSVLEGKNIGCMKGKQILGGQKGKGIKNSCVSEDEMQSWWEDKAFWAMPLLCLLLQHSLYTHSNLMYIPEYQMYKFGF